VRKLKNKFTVLFLFLFVASIVGGMALRNTLNYSMIIGVGLALIFLLATAFSLKKKNSET
jgi:hypothetical protein